MKKVISLIFILIFSMSLLACSRNGEQVVSEAVLSTEHIDEFIYQVEQIDLSEISDANFHASALHDEQIYVIYSGLNSGESGIEYMLAGISAAGEVMHLTELPFNGFVQIAGMQIKESNRLAVFIMEVPLFDDGKEISAHYAEYDFDGNELFKRDFTGFLPQLSSTSSVRQAVFTNDGNIALSFQQDRLSFVYLLSTSNDSVTMLQHDFYMQGNCIVRLEDDRIFVLDTESDEAILREVDFDGKGFGDSHPVIAGSASSLHSVSGDSSFDLLISDNNNICGYSLMTGEQMVLLNWIETGFFDTADISLGMFTDGKLYIVTGRWGAQIDAYILRPVARDEFSSTENPAGKTVLTLGGLRISAEIRSAVIEFNNESKDYSIELIDYVEADDDWLAGLSRFQIDLITGRGPDIIIDLYGDLRLPGLMLDLYPFIDADPELNREDFFKSFLHSMESTDGSLYKISDTFYIMTMVGIKSNLGDIETWTLSELKSLIEGSLDMSQPLGVLSTGGGFVLNMLENPDFIDMENYKANLDNEAFIEILETAKLLPREQDMSGALIHQLLLVLSGKQLLTEWQFYNFYDFQAFADILGDDFLLLGRPSQRGGINTAFGHNALCINASSENPHGAWEFLRRFLLPVEIEIYSSDIFHDSTYHHRFPIRIDTFEALIADVKTPRMAIDVDGKPIEDDDGRPVELPRVTYLLWHWADGVDLGQSLELYSMTDEVATKLRSFIESAQPPGNRLDRDLSVLIWSDLNTFFDGIRTAEDTARIIQNRAQIYLSEQELLR